MKNANTLGYFDFFEYLKGKFDNKIYNQNIVKYLKREVLKLIQEYENNLNNQNFDYKSKLKNKIDDLYNMARRSITNKQEELKKKIEEERINNQAKKGILEEIKNYINSLL